MANEKDLLYYGRRPSLGSHGGERGYRTRPGAPMADPSRNVGSTTFGPNLDSLTPASNWDRMFHNHITQQTPSSLAAARAAGQNPGSVPRGTNGGTNDIASDEQFGGGTNPATGAAGPTGTPSLQSMAGGGDSHTARWSAPPLRGPDRSMPAAPFMPQDPSRPFRVPAPITGPLGNAGSDRANYGANAGMYAPGGAMGFWGGSTAAQGWQGPTGRGVAPGEYTTPYGSARVDKMVPGTKSYGWGGSFEDRTA